MKEKPSPLARAWRQIGQGVRTVFQPAFLAWLKQLLVFFVIYSLLYMVLYKTIHYTLPFLLALLFAWMMQPMMRLLTRRLKWKRGPASTLMLILFIIVFTGLLVLVVWRLIVECFLLFDRIAHIDLNPLIQDLQQLMDRWGIHFFSDTPEEMDVIRFLTDNLSRVQSMIRGSINIATAILNAIVSIVTSLPSIVLMIVLIFFATFYFCRDLFGNDNALQKKIFRPIVHKRATQLYRQGLMLLGRYILAYLKLIAISGVMTSIAFIIFDLPYALVFGLLAAVLDLFPIVGISLIFIPAALIVAVQGNWMVAAGLIVALIIITVVRQVVEPKMVSESINIHPLIPLTCFFCSLQFGSVNLFIYLMSLVLAYILFRRSGLLDLHSPFQDSSVNF